MKKPALFEFHSQPEKNHLPYDGEVYYHGRVFTDAESDQYMAELRNDIEWYHDKAIIFGKTITTKRMVAWYAEEAFSYRYSGTTKIALPWTASLRKIKQKIESLTSENYNSCLLNLYHDGSEGMAWHSDGEKELRKNGSIASVSFGAERKFSFKHKKSKEKIDLWLESGSLLEMTGTTQRYWLHRLPPTKKVGLPRINLTFRQMDKKIAK